MRSPERHRQTFERAGDWASPVSNKYQQQMSQNMDIGADRQRNLNPFQEESKHSVSNVSRSIDPASIGIGMQHQTNQRVDQSQTNFSDALAGRNMQHAPIDASMQREDIATGRESGDGIDKLDELEQMALEALDDI